DSACHGMAGAAGSHPTTTEIRGRVELGPYRLLVEIAEGLESQAFRDPDAAPRFLHLPFGERNHEAAGWLVIAADLPPLEKPHQLRDVGLPQAGEPASLRLPEVLDREPVAVVHSLRQHAGVAPARAI